MLLLRLLRATSLSQRDVVRNIVVVLIAVLVVLRLMQPLKSESMPYAENEEEKMPRLPGQGLVPALGKRISVGTAMNQDRHDPPPQQPMNQQRNDDIVRIVVISDTHLLHSKLELPPLGVDVLIHCGDFTSYGSLTGVRDFRRWFSAQTQFTDRIIVDGNHDRNRSDPNAMDLSLEFAATNTGVDDANHAAGSIRFLQDETIVCANDRLRVHGFSWDSCSQDRFALPSDAGNHPVDLWVAHMPARLRPSHQQGRRRTGAHGSHTLAMLALEHRVPLSVGGHFHWERGAVGYWEDDAQGNPHVVSWLINAASKRRDETVQPPIIIDYNWRTRAVENLEGLTNENTYTINLEEAFRHVPRSRQDTDKPPGKVQ